MMFGGFSGLMAGMSAGQAQKAAQAQSAAVGQQQAASRRHMMMDVCAYRFWQKYGDRYAGMKDGKPIIHSKTRIPEVAR